MSHLKSGYEKKIIAYCITVIILLILAALIYFLYFINQDIEIRILGSIVIMLILGIWFYLERRITKQLENTVYESDIKRFVLITRDGERQKEWCCKGACSFLIGKSSINHEVDIDLADTYYMEYVSPFSCCTKLCTRILVHRGFEFYKWSRTKKKRRRICFAFKAYDFL